jgi:mono/diheme cytochrome c family protein
VVEGFAAENGESVMPNNFGETLTEEQIGDLVSFLLTLE